MIDYVSPEQLWKNGKIAAPLDEQNQGRFCCLTRIPQMQYESECIV